MSDCLPRPPASLVTFHFPVPVAVFASQSGLLMSHIFILTFYNNLDIISILFENTHEWPTLLPEFILSDAKNEKLQGQLRVFLLLLNQYVSVHFYECDSISLKSFSQRCVCVGRGQKGSNILIESRGPANAARQMEHFLNPEDLSHITIW